MRKTASVGKECVACGCCAKGCPKKAIAVHKGVRAMVSEQTCLGCGGCAKVCPAGVIEIREVAVREETVA